MVFQDNLTFLMEEHDISNVKLGKILGVSDTSIMKWKRGDVIPAIDKALKIAEYFGVSVDELLGKRIDTDRNVLLPLVGVISAGPFDILNEDAWDEYRSVSVRMLADRPQKECVLMTVDGESMMPYLLPGDNLIVHRPTYAVNGNIIIAYDPVLNGFTVKRYQQNGDSVVLKPFNDQFQPMKYSNPTEQELRLYGVCVGMERKLV